MAAFTMATLREIPVAGLVEQEMATKAVALEEENLEEVVEAKPCR